PASLPWEERSVLENYGVGIGARIDEIPYDDTTGNLDVARFDTELARQDVFGVLVDLPNGFGHIDENLLDLKKRLHSVPLVVSADPLALSVLEPPGAWGADVVIGEGQSFGTPNSFGGPLLGLFACRKEHVRSAPGRIVGATRDSEGRRAFTLTLQTREQHIRRSGATSNICTNESLLALGFVAYASLVGARGLARLAERLNERARALVQALSGIDGLRAPRFSAPFLTDFTIELQRGEPSEFLGRLQRRKVLGGYALSDPRPGRGERLARAIRVGVHEGISDRAIELYASAARSAVAKEETNA
ncbi:MAG: glycine dehydrogenase, partial [Thermoplasmata archaeon]